MPQDLRSIAGLIQDYRDRTDDSYGDMAAKSERHGAPVTRAVFQRLATRPLKNFPDPPTIHALAAIIDVPVTTVVLGAAVSLGLQVQGDTEAMWLPGGTEHLTAEDRAAIRAVTRALVDARTPTAVITNYDAVVDTVVDTEQPIDGPEPAVQYDYTLAARRGPSEGRRLRQEQDDDAEQH